MAHYNHQWPVTHRVQSLNFCRLVENRTVSWKRFIEHIVLHCKREKKNPKHDLSRQNMRCTRERVCACVVGSSNAVFWYHPLYYYLQITHSHVVETLMLHYKNDLVKVINELRLPHTIEILARIRRDCFHQNFSDPNSLQHTKVHVSLEKFSTKFVLTFFSTYRFLYDSFSAV